MLDKEDWRFIKFMVGLGVLCGIIMWLAVHSGKKDTSTTPQQEDYITAHACETEDIMIIDGVEKVRYLCNAEESKELV